MAAYNLTDYDSMLKDMYTPEQVRRLSYSDNPLLGMIKKKRAGGRRYVQPVMFGHPGGASADFTKAKTNQTGSYYEDFLITRTKQYQLITLDTELFVSTEGNLDAFEPAFDEFDKGFMGLSEKLNRRLYRTKSGRIGRIATGGISGAVITLDDKADAFNFEKGMKCAFSTADGGGALRSAGATLTVLTVDRESGTVTFTANVATLADVVVTDYVFQDGDYDACAAGLESWLPVDNRSAALAASFFGVTRSNGDVDRLGGIYLDGTTGGDINEIVVTLVNKVVKHGGKPDLVIMNSEWFGLLQLLWLSKHHTFENVGVNVTERINDRLVTFTDLYSGMVTNIGGRKVTVICDRSCPSTRLYVLQRDTWTMWHSFDLPGFILKASGKEILRVPDSEDSVECRVGAYYNLGCSAPGWNGVAKLTAL